MKRALMAASLLATIAVGGCTTKNDASTDQTPIRFGVIADDPATNPYSVIGVRAAVKAINAAGGIKQVPAGEKQQAGDVKGRPLEVDVCDNSGDPDLDVACVRRAAQQHWVAVVGGYDTVAPQRIMMSLDGNTIPYIGQIEGTVDEFKARMSFPVEVGTVGTAVGTAALMVKAGCRRSTVVTDPRQPGATERDAQLKATLGKSARFLNVGAGALAPAGAPDCVFFSGTGEDAVTFFSSLHRSGSKAKLFAPPVVLTPDVIKDLGPIAEGIRGASGVPLVDDRNPSTQKYLADLRAYDPNAVTNELTLNGYAAVLLLAKGLREMQDATISSTGLYMRLIGLDSVRVMSFPAMNFKKSRRSKLYPRQYHTMVWDAVIRNGQWLFAAPGGRPSDIDRYLP